MSRNSRHLRHPTVRMKKFKLDPVLGSLLKSCNVQQFTIPDLRDAYLEAPGCKHQSIQAAQQFIYKNVLRLEAKGLIERMGSLKGKSIRFRMVQASHTSPTEPAKAIGGTRASLDDEEVHRTLSEKLNRYKVELLSTMGEAEEYDAICKELPQMKPYIQDLYSQARDRITQILGKIKAVETAIARPS